MPEGHVELILQWKVGADTDRVCNWLKERGIEFDSMKSGLLISGDKEIFNRHLAIRVDDTGPSAQLPVPPQLQNDVTSIMFRKPPSLLA
jgi:hypothetical protein